MNDSPPDFPIVGVGASAGAPGVLRDLLAGFSGDLGMALVVLLPEAAPLPLADPCLAARMRPVTGEAVLEPGQVYLVPPGHQARLAGGRLAVSAPEAPPEALSDASSGLHQPIDPFFETLGTGMGRRAAGVILGRSGVDGSRGLRAIKENGGLAVAHAGAEGPPLVAGLADVVESARNILPRLARCFQVPADALGPEDGHLPASAIAALCREMHEVTGHDVSGYARGTLTRCIGRRLRVLGLAGPQAYLGHLRDDPAECEALLRDLTVNVSHFFRDPAGFAALDAALEPLIRDCPEGETLRLWVPGCSSGEEAYSLALLLRAAMRRLDRFPRVSITATDIDPRLLALARAAHYPLSALAEIPEPLRAGHTVVAEDGFTLAPPIRDMVRFCSHSLIADPPFARLDLVSCRHVLEGFEPGLQRATLARLGDALRPGGLLLLGAGESPEGLDAHFEGLSPGQRLFRRRPAPLAAEAPATDPPETGPPDSGPLHPLPPTADQPIHLAAGPDESGVAQLATERARLRRALDIARIGLWEYDPATGATELDPTECALFDLPDAQAHRAEQVLARLHPEDRERVAAALHKVSAGAPEFDQTFRVTTAFGPDRWLRGLGRFTLRAGAPRILGVSFDVSAERRLLEEQALHLSEVNHRIKNLFAVVSAMISSVERESTDTQDFSRNLRGRISALDRAHALMRRDDMRAPIPLDQLIERVLEPSRGGQAIVVEGPETLVPIRELTPLVLILHEWTTNSAKYGALAGQGGALTIRWSQSADSFGLDWTESAGGAPGPAADPAANPAEGSGFGSRLVQASILQLRAELDRGVGDGLLHYRLTMPPFAAP